MRLHRAGNKADWHTIRPARRNFWQRLANISGGTITPANTVSLAGLALVMYGAVLLLGEHYFSGLLAIITGRLADVLDGLVAEKTMTKGPIGEALDAVIDKLAILILIPVILIGQLLPFTVLVIIVLQNIINTVIAAGAKLKYVELRPTITGKIATAAGWVSIVTFIMLTVTERTSHSAWLILLLIIAYGSLIIFVVNGLRASRDYARLVFGPPRLDLFGELEHVVVVINPQASNFRRVQKRIKELAILLPAREMVIIETARDTVEFASRLQRALAGKAGLTLVAIGGGDGTVNLVLNTLMTLRPKINLEKTPILPLWGGNANDLAYMLNGLSSRTRLRQVLGQGKLVAIHPFKVKTVTRSHAQTIRYAAAYATFGAIAYAANQLAKPRKQQRLTPRTTFGKLLNEMVLAIRAWLDAPAFDAEQDGQQLKIFEQVFANGSRMAKVDRLPVTLNERKFYQASGSDKHPVFFLLRLLGGRQVGSITNQTAHFTTKERAWAQFDGEVAVLPKDTVVSVEHADTPFYAVSTKLEPSRHLQAKRSHRHRTLKLLLTALALLVIFHVWLHVTNPYANLSIVQQPYATYVRGGEIGIIKNFNLKTYSNTVARSLGYYKSGFLIVQNTFGPSQLTDTKSISQTLDHIHQLRFDPSKPYLISGNQFSAFYPRNLGVFYNSLLDPRTARSQADWQHRQQIYLQSALYALDAFSNSHQLTTTIVPIGSHEALLSEVHPGSQPSDSLYGLLFALRVLTQPSAQSSKSYSIQTIASTQDIVHTRRTDLRMLLRLYLDTVQDPQTGMVKRHLALSGARDGVIRDSSFYDNVVLWSTLRLADQLGIAPYSAAYLNNLRAAIIDKYWDESTGIFSDEYRDDAQPAVFSADWMIALPTGFLRTDNIQDQAKLTRIVDYSERAGLTTPLPIRYTTGSYHGQVPAAVRWFEPNYGGNVIWSYWGAQYITLLDDLQRTTHDGRYGQLAARGIRAYDQRIRLYGGFPETYKSDGTFLKTVFYKSILDTGWVVQYELARSEYAQNNR